MFNNPGQTQALEYFGDGNVINLGAVWTSFLSAERLNKHSDVVSKPWFLYPGTVHTKIVVCEDVQGVKKCFFLPVTVLSLYCPCDPCFLMVEFLFCSFCY